MLKYLIPLIFLIACGREPVRVDSELQVYVDRFNQDTGLDVSDVQVYFEPIKLPAVGQCQTYSGKSGGIIKIDKVFWDKVNETVREELIYHELGHCTLKLDHNNSMDNKGCPISIMYSYVFGGSDCYIKNRQYYLDEIKSHI